MTKPQNLWTLVKINTDDLTANIRKVKLTLIPAPSEKSQGEMSGYKVQQKMLWMF